MSDMWWEDKVVKLEGRLAEAERDAARWQLMYRTSDRYALQTALDAALARQRAMEAELSSFIATAEICMVSIAEIDDEAYAATTLLRAKIDAYDAALDAARGGGK